MKKINYQPKTEEQKAQAQYQATHQMDHHLLSFIEGMISYDSFIPNGEDDLLQTKMREHTEALSNLIKENLKKVIESKAFEYEGYPPDAVVSKRSYDYRREKGWTREEAAYRPSQKRVQSPKYVTEDQRNRAKENGISLNTLNRRVLAGWDMERAITEPSSRKKGRK